MNTQRPLAETLQQQFPWCQQWEQDLTKLYRAYVERKQQLGLVDYDDLLLYWHLLVSEPKFAQHVGAHFDHILFCEVLEHLTNHPLRAVLQLKKVLKPDGMLVLTTPNAARLENVVAFIEGRNIYDPYSAYGPYGRHNREYTRHELHQ